MTKVRAGSSEVRATATDELRRLLDERGVEYEADDGKTVKVTRWKAYGEWVSFIEYDTGETRFCIDARRFTPEQAIAATLGPQITGETSDGYHTFNELYHHRAVLFSVIVRDYQELAWKSKLHHDGTMYDGMFIVGIETPQGQATYHYDINPYWDMFDCRELERAPEWDGHSPDEAIRRIATLGSSNCSNSERATKDSERDSDERGECRARLYKPEHGSSDCTICECGEINDISANYCNRCGRQIKVVSE